MPYLSASAVVFHYEAPYEVYLYLTYSISSISGLVAKATGLHSTSLGSTAAGIDMSL